MEEMAASSSRACDAVALVSAAFFLVIFGGLKFFGFFFSSEKQR
jgi:hypothetical protein